MSDAVREVGRRLGYTDAQMAIEDTDDVLNTVIIPAGMNYAEFIDQAAVDKGWVGKAEKLLEFHPYRWAKDKKKPRAVFTYGGPDILSLDLDADFRLPPPSKVKIKSYSPIFRGADIRVADKNNAGIEDSMARVNVLGSNRAVAIATGGKVQFGDVTPTSKTRQRNLTRSEVFYGTAGTLRTASHKAQRRFENQHVRAMALNISLAGLNRGLADEE